MVEDSHGKADPTESERAEHRSTDRTTGGGSVGPDVSRRWYLLGSAAAIGGLGSLTSVSRGQSDSVDVVEFGADPTGSEPINDVLSDALAQYSRVTFPPGEYRVSGDLSIGGDGWELTGVNSTLVLDDGGLDLSGSGWRFDGFEIDYRGQDGFGKCLLGDSNWTFGNVVFRGTRQVDVKAPLFVPWVTAGSSALMHDVYAHEGNADGDEDGKAKLMWQDEDMAGTLHIERLWAERWSENTIYASDMEGALIVRDSYFRNTNSGCIRGAERIEAHGCTFVADGPIPGQWNEERKGATEFKGVWCNFNRGSGNGVAVIDDCDFYYTHESGVGSGVELDGPGDSVSIDNSRFHSTFSVRMVDGAGENMDKSGSGNVVSGGFDANVSSIGATTSSEPATDGTPPLPEPPELGQTPNGRDQDTTPTDGGSGNWNLLRVEGDGDGSTGAEFTFTVSGDLRHLTPEDDVLQAGHGVTGSTATEDVWSGVEEYEFTGDVTEFQVDGPATLYLNGQGVSIAELTGQAPPTDEEPADEPQSEHRLEIVAPEHVEYRFSTTGEITMSLDNGDRAAEAGNDAVAQNADGTWSAEGSTGNGYGDTFDFVGDAVEFQTLVGDCVLYLDGEEVTVEELTGQVPTDEPQPEHRLEIVAPEHVEYRFSTSGEATKVLDAGDRSAEADNDVLAQNADGSWTAEGSTGNGYGDTYDFAGEVLEFEMLAGDCVLYLDGEERTVDELLGVAQPTEPLPNTIAIEGVGSGQGEYSFSVTGALEKHESLGTRDQSDTIDGNSASGVIDAGDVDAYRFEGDLTSINLTGSATISLDPQAGS